MNNAAIGVFDSGVGGLTVVKEIMEQCPNEKIIYFGDTARVPYGNKSKETIIKYSKQIERFLLSKEVKAIVIACNTASAFALEALKKQVKIPVIGVIEAGAKMAASETKNKKIGVIGTEGTVNSNVYVDVLKGLKADIEVKQQACPLFVPLVEEGWTDDVITEQVVQRYLSSLIENEVDTLIMGCTHYPLLKDMIGKVMGSDVKLINPAFETARSLKEILEAEKLLSSADTKETPGHLFYVSDGADKFRKFANTILPCGLIDIGDVFVKTFE